MEAAKTKPVSPRKQHTPMFSRPAARRKSLVHKDGSQFTREKAGVTFGSGDTGLPGTELAVQQPLRAQVSWGLAGDQGISSRVQQTSHRMRPGQGTEFTDRRGGCPLPVTLGPARSLNGV